MIREDDAKTNAKRRKRNELRGLSFPLRIDGKFVDEREGPGVTNEG